MTTKPSRTDLLSVIGVMQTTFGRIQAASSDRNQNRQAHIDALCRFGQDLAVQARDADKPDAGQRSRWNIPQPDLTKIA